MLRRLRSTAGKLTGRSRAEFQVRGGQAVAAVLERWGLGDNVASFDDRRLLKLADAERSAAGDDARLLAGFRAAGASSGPFTDAGSRASTLAALRATCPDDEQRAIAQADRILAGRFDLMGYADLSYGDPVDWHTDPVNGRRAPLLHWSRIPYLDVHAVGDHKVTWEVNRQQYLVILGQAYWYTSDSRYADGAARLIDAWLAANPPKQGINWASSLEVAYRAISWLWALCLFRDAAALTPALFRRLLTAVDVHGRHVARHLSTYFSPNTHLTGEALGLYYIGTLLPQLRGAAEWRETGRRILVEQAAIHVRPDGVYFEQASQYHRYTVEIFLQFMLLAERAGDPEAAAAVREPLDRLFTHLRYLARPDGRIPLIGDDDGGRLVQLDARPAADVRALLTTGAIVLGRGDLLPAEWPDEPDAHLAAPLWLLGADVVQTAVTSLEPRDPAPVSRLFPDGGFAVMRDGWRRDASWTVVDCGPHGTMNCGHAHADALAVQVAVRGRPLLVDAGTYSYPGAERDVFRGGAAHNVVTIDGASSSEPGRTAFSWSAVATCRQRAWESTPEYDYFEGTHDGFERIDASLRYDRAVVLVRRQDGAVAYWIVRDRMSATASHCMTARWHVAPGLALSVDGPRVHVADGEDGIAVATLHAAAAPGTDLEADVVWHIDPGWVSPAYGAREAAPVARWGTTAAPRHDVATFIVPTETFGPSPRIIALDADGGRAWAVEGPWGRDLLLLGDASGTEASCEGIRSDAAWTIVRTTATDDARLWMRREGSRVRFGNVDL